MRVAITNLGSSVPPSPASASAKPATARSLLSPILRRSAPVLLWALPLAFADFFAYMVVAILIGFTIDHAIANLDLTLTALGAAACVVIVIVGVFLQTIGAWALQREAVTTLHHLRVAVPAAVLDPTSRPVQRPSGEILSISTSDASTASEIFDALEWAAPASVMIVLSALWLAWVDLWRGLGA